jgi:hypothetical protein
MFSADAFVRDVQAASVAADPVAAVQEVVAAVIADGPSIDAALGTTLKAENDSLFSSEGLTVQRIIWLPGLPSVPHEHQCRTPCPGKAPRASQGSLLEAELETG